MFLQDEIHERDRFSDFMLAIFRYMTIIFSCFITSSRIIELCQAKVFMFWNRTRCCINKSSYSLW